MENTSSSAPRLLVMEDDAGLARLLQRRLEREGFEVHVARDGEEGLAKFAAGGYDALAIDYEMPIHNGLQVIRILRERGPVPPVVMLTGTGNELVAVEVMKLGAADYIVKDVEGHYLDLLPAVLTSVMERGRLAEAKRRSDEALRESEERFRAIANYTYDWESWIGTKGETLWVNPAVERMTGYTVREAMHMLDYPIQIIHPDDRERMAEVFRGAQAGSSGADIQFRILHKDGSVIWGAIAWQPIYGENGDCLGFRSSVRNITQRKRAEDALDSMRKQLRHDDSAFAGIVGRHPRMRTLFETIREVVDTDVPVHIYGDSGTGKELVAHAIHNNSARANKPFIAVNCSALPASLLESELFGHVKGAFTGAIKAKRGRFELADGGTIFLDEVGDLSTSVQVSLLRVLQEGMIDRVGDERSTRVDVRVLSATHKDLRKEVATGRFREDLYYRLCVIPIEVPPLRERRDDIPLLAAHILGSISRVMPGKDIVFSEEAMDILMAYRWPGNVRELQNAIHFAAVKCKGEEIQPVHLPPTIASHAALEAVGAGAGPARRGRKPVLNLEAVEQALRYANGNKVEAARHLGVSRATLYRYLDDADD